jgi:hypothetical protein
MDVESLGVTGEDERGLEDLTRRLREESERLAARYPPSAFTLHEVRTLRSGRRRRRLAVRAAAAVLFVAAGAWTWTALRPPADHGPPIQPAPAALTGTGGRDPSRAREPAPTPGASDDAAPAQATLVWRFVITLPDEQGGRRVVGTGLYIPEQRREVTFNQLSPAEQYAVLRALGTDNQPQWQL